MFLGVLDTNVNGDIRCLALRIIHWQNHVRPRDIVERLRDPKYDCAEEASETIEKLRSALKPFALSEHNIERWFGVDNPDSYIVSQWVTVGDLRAAAAALKETGDE